MRLIFVGQYYGSRDECVLDYIGTDLSDHYLFYDGITGWLR